MFTIISIIVVCGFVLVLKELSTNKRRSSYRNRGRNSNNQSPYNPPLDLSDSSVQLKLVSSKEVDFSISKIMGYGEYKVFNVIEKNIIPSFHGCRVFAQVSLGEILQSKSKQAYSCINSKRVDILIVDRTGAPIVAIEYQGEGHHNNDAAARTAVKKEALRKAGVSHIEILPEHASEDIKHLVKRAIECKLHATQDNNNVVDLPAVQ